MPNVPSMLTVTSPLSGGERMVINQGRQPRIVTLSQVGDFLKGWFIKPSDVQVGEVITTAAGSQAQVTVTDGKFNFAIPQGADGAAGPQGNVGSAGDAGTAGSKGDTGEGGATGPKGNPGAKGDVGLPGAKGDIGARGDIGPTGPQGADGAPQHHTLITGIAGAGGAATINVTGFSSILFADFVTTWASSNQMITGAVTAVSGNTVSVLVKRSRGTLLLSAGAFEDAPSGTPFTIRVVGVAS